MAKLHKIGLLLVVCALLVSSVPLHQSKQDAKTTPIRYTCYFDEQDNSYYIKEGISSNGIATADYFDELFSTGWGRLYVNTNQAYSEEKQMFCAGYLEGATTAKQISVWYQSYMTNELINGTMSPKLTNWLTSQMEWTRSQSLANKENNYWYHLHLLFQQFDGLVYGYNQLAKENNEYASIQPLGMYALNAAGDMETLIDLFETPVKKTITGRRLMKGQLQEEDYNDEMLDCSAFVKVLPGMADVVAGHTTWTAYYSMNRIYKQYDFPLANVAARKVSFSSRPGFLASKDDFYMMDSGLVSMETTNSVYIESMFDAVVPHTVLTWQRVILANRLAKDGDDWTNMFSEYNSGTYNNQWMVVDYNQFVPHKSIKDGLLWIIEQMPGKTVRGDVTDRLRSDSYWPSFNIPYFADTYTTSGYKGACPGDGQCPAYVGDPRYKIFKRLQQNVNNVEDFKFVMQYNDYQNDTESKGDPGNSISSRFDLRTTKSAAFGGIDSKVVSLKSLVPFECDIISGPTHQQQKPFSWKDWSKVFHPGIPDYWNFNWMRFKPDPSK